MSKPHSHSDLQTRLSNLAYDALGHNKLDEFRDYICMELESLFNASGSAFFHWGKSRAQPELLAEEDIVFPVHWDSFRKKQYLQEVYKSDPVIHWLHRGAFNQAKGVVRVTDIVQCDHYINSPLYQEFLRPLHSHYILTLAFSIRNALIGNISLLRPADSDNFSEQDENAARQIVPLLSAAYSKLMLSEELLLKDAIIHNLENYHADNALFILAKDFSCISKSIGGELLLETLQAAGVTSMGNLLFRSNALINGINQWRGEKNNSQLAVFDNIDIQPHQTLSIFLTSLPGASRDPHYFVRIKLTSVNLPLRQAALNYKLSNRECEVLELMLEGHTNAEIGDSLTISQWTVKNHVQSIYKKTGARNRTALTNKVLKTN